MGWRRRQLLTVVGGTGVAALAGCSGLVTGDEESNLVSQQAKLLPGDGDSEDRFGEDVALADDGSTALVGAPNDEDPNGTEGEKEWVEGGGAAYVFDSAGGTQRHRAKLAVADGDGGDQFGTAVALTDDGSTALIGADYDEDSNGEETGSAYVFARSGTSWSQQAKLVPDDGGYRDQFGDAVALADDGSTALIGAHRDEDPNGEEAGSAYVFTRDGTSWSQQAKLAPDDGDSDDEFGDAVALTDGGSTALIGAPYDEDPNGEEAGSAYVFARSGTSWSQQAKLASDDGDDINRFGDAVALADDGSTALIGATQDLTGVGEFDGSAHVFARDGTSWSQQAKLVPDDPGYEDKFGEDVALADSGSTAFIGANADEDPNGNWVVSAYVFARSGASWSQQAKLAPDDGGREDAFGLPVSLAVDDSTVLVGAATDEDPNGKRAGSAYVFEGPWEQ